MLLLLFLASVSGFPVCPPGEGLRSGALWAKGLQGCVGFTGLWYAVWGAQDRVQERHIMMRYNNMWIEAFRENDPGCAAFSYWNGPTGTVKGPYGDPVCARCPAGTYSYEVQTGISVCRDCALNFKSRPGSASELQCTPCVGRGNNVVGGSAFCCAEYPHLNRSDGSCPGTCDPGSGLRSGANQYLLRTMGCRGQFCYTDYGAVATSVQWDGARWVRSSDPNCGCSSFVSVVNTLPATQPPSGALSCVPCPAGTFQHEVEPNIHICAQCPLNYVSPAASSALAACVPCAGLGVSVFGGSPHCKCPNGAYGNTGTTICSACAPGSAAPADAVGAASCSACANSPPPNAVQLPGCDFLCYQGYYRDGASCRACSYPFCPSQTFRRACNATMDSACVPCTPCAPGTLVLAQCGIADTMCVPCPTALPPYAQWTEQCQWACTYGANFSACLGPPEATQFVQAPAPAPEETRSTLMIILAVLIAIGVLVLAMCMWDVSGYVAVRTVNRL